MSRSTQELLNEAMVHLELANQYATDEDLDQLVIDAICMRLSAGIEVLAGVDPHVRARLLGDNWQLMWGMRNRISHGQLLMDPDIIRRTIEADLPEMVRMVGQELSDI